MSARDSKLRSNVQSAMSTAMESRDNFQVTKGMTIMDYAAIRGHAAVIEYLGWLEKDPASPVAGRVGLAGLGFAPSNWREKPVQKAVTMGHLSAVPSANRLCKILEGGISSSAVLFDGAGKVHRAVPLVGFWVLAQHPVSTPQECGVASEVRAGCFSGVSCPKSCDVRTEFRQIST
jgi:hypothetical protein